MRKLGASDKVGERVSLIQHASVLEPSPPVFRTAADMGNGPDESPIEQAQSGMRKGRVAIDSVRPVGVHHHRIVSVSIQPFAICERNRDPLTIGGFRIKPLAPIICGVEATQHGRLLFQLALLTY